MFIEQRLFYMKYTRICVYINNMMSDYAGYSTGF